jgi:hypothetical protein
MRFITVRELSTKPRSVWARIKKEDLVVTLNGKPIGLLSGVTEETLERRLQSLRRSRALMALEEMQQRAMDEGLSRMSPAQIEAEIRAVRRERRQ